MDGRARPPPPASAVAAARERKDLVLFGFYGWGSPEPLPRAGPGDELDDRRGERVEMGMRARPSMTMGRFE